MGARAKPILFSAPMVRALLREVEAPGTGKTMTRRVLKPQPVQRDDGLWDYEHRAGGVLGADAGEVAMWMRDLAPWQEGDLLWVREAHYLTDNGHEECVVYAEDDAAVRDHLESIRRTQAIHKLSADWARPHLHLRPSIHMPRWASRLTLTVEDVRVERLQDISEDDARAEGVEGYETLDAETGFYVDHYLAFRDLWESINGADSWAANPFVAAIRFRPHLVNVDAFLALANAEPAA